MCESWDHEDPSKRGQLIRVGGKPLKRPARAPVVCDSCPARWRWTPANRRVHRLWRLARLGLVIRTDLTAEELDGLTLLESEHDRVLALLQARALTGKV